MPIITISRGSYHHGRAVAEKVAERLDYPCLSRDSVIDQLKEFHLPEIKLVRNLHDAFSILDRFPNGKRRYTTAIRSALLSRFKSSHIVYHGLVGHHFVAAIGNVIKVRVIADTETRITDEMTRENISAEQARYILKKDDDERRKWGMFLYGIDIAAPENYDLVVNIGRLSEDEAADIIVSSARAPAFADSDQALGQLADLALAAGIQDALFDFPSAVIAVRDGEAKITLKAPAEQHERIAGRIEEMLSAVHGLGGYTLKFAPYF